MDGDGNINYEEFVTMLFKVKINEYKKVQKYEVATNGIINHEEFVTMLFKMKTRSKIQKIKLQKCMNTEIQSYRILNHISNPGCWNLGSKICIVYNCSCTIFQKPHGISTGDKKKKGPLKKIANV